MFLHLPRGASRTRFDGSRMTALQIAKKRAADPKTKGDPGAETIVKLLTDEAFLKKYVEELLPRINQLRVRRSTDPPVHCPP
jgi:hypothetical protein